MATAVLGVLFGRSDRQEDVALMVASAFSTAVWARMPASPESVEPAASRLLMRSTATADRPMTVTSIATSSRKM